ncbi:MAG: beta-propeller fold lactonase family protein [Candidatus Cybelea sp.]
MLQTRFVNPTLSALGLALLLAACSGSSGGVTPSAAAPGSQWRSHVAADAVSGQYAFISDWNTGDIDTYAIDAKSGALKSLGLTATVAGGGTQPVTIDPTGKFAYVADYGSNDVYAFTIDATSGKLTPVSGSPFAAGTEPDGATTDPKGKFVYVANFGSDNVYGYAINSSTGALTPVKGSPFTVNGAALWVGLDLKGKFAYVPSYNASGAGDVAAFTINASTGALTPVAGSPVAAGAEPSWMTVDPNDKFVYVTNLGSNDISAYAIAKSGALKPVPKSPFRAGGEPYSAIVDPTGKFLYEDNLASLNVSAYTIDATSGALKPVPGSPFATGINPENIAVDSTGSFVYVANFGTNYFTTGNIFAYAIDKTSGALKRVKGSPFDQGGHYTGVAICKRVGSTCPPPLPL